MRVPLTAHHEPAGGPEQAAKYAICFWTQKVIYSNPCSTHPHCDILTYQICYNTPICYIAAIFVRYGYTTGSWLFCFLAVQAAHHEGKKIIVKQYFW